jgi:hypothetical protein
MDDVAINEFSSVEHWQPPFTIIITRAGVRVQDKNQTVAQLIAPKWYSADQKARIGHTFATMLELRHANWEASL